MQKKAFKFGVEIECAVPDAVRRDVATQIEDWGCVFSSDGSIGNLRPGYGGVEIKTPPLGYNATLRMISKVCKLLEDYNVYGNSTCGLHVHCSNRKFMMPRYIKRIINTWLAIEDVLTSTQPSSRFNNSYCVRLLREHVRGTLDDLPHDKDLILRKIENDHQIAHGSRYYALNVMSLNQHKTLECRLHAYSANSKKINNWITVLRAVYNYALEDYDQRQVDELFKMKISMDKIDKVWEMLKLPEKVRVFYNHKITRHLFDSLGRQQESANKRLELADVKKKVMERYQKAREESNAIERQEREVLSAFS
jgi:hypothetical protein